MQVHPLSGAFLALFCILAAGPQSAGAASGKKDALPNLNIEADCRDVAKMDTNRTLNFSGSINEEKQAREQLRKVWSSYSTGMHENCMHLVTPPDLRSYVTLQGYLTTAQDAKAYKKRAGLRSSRHAEFALT